MKLRTKLTPAEIDQRREMIIELLSERATVDQEKKEAAKEFREALKRLDKRIEGLRAEASEGYDLREVEVDERISGERVITFRRDTGETVSQRRMQESERAAREAREELEDLDDEDDDDGDEEPPAAPQAARRGRRTRTREETPGGQGDPWADLEERAKASG